MSSLIVYCSSHGATRKAAELVKKNLKGDVELIDIEYVTSLQITDGFENIIIGSPIRLGQVHRKIGLFVEENFDILFKKNIGLFICCLSIEEAHKHFKNNFSDELLNHANSHAVFGGELDLSKISIYEKILVKYVKGYKANQRELNIQKIEEFANEMNKTSQLVHS